MLAETLDMSVSAFSPITPATPLLLSVIFKRFNSLSLTIQHLVRAFFYRREGSKKERKSALSKKGGALRQLRSIH